MGINVDALRSVFSAGDAPIAAGAMDHISSMVHSTEDASMALGVGSGDNIAGGAVLGRLRAELSPIADSLVGAGYADRLYGAQLAREPVLQALRSAELSGGDAKSIAALAQDVLKADQLTPEYVAGIRDLAEQHVAAAGVGSTMIVPALKDLGMVEGSAAKAAIVPRYESFAKAMDAMHEAVSGGTVDGVSASEQAAMSELEGLRTAITDSLGSGAARSSAAA
jgi:hypothetical protein